MTFLLLLFVSSGVFVLFFVRKRISSVLSRSIQNCLGYPSSKKGYKCDSPELRKCFVSMDVTLNESVPLFYPIG